MSARCRRSPDRHRRHRLDAGRDGAGADDDPGARPLLRRPGALEEHPQHLHDVRRRDRRRRRSPGRRSATRSPSTATAHLIGGLGNAFLSGVDFAPARRDDDPRAGLLRLPGDLLHHHRRARLRRGGRADAVRRLPRLRGALVGARLRGARPLGLRRRLAAGGRHPRLRRRRPGRDGLRLLGPGGGAGRRRPQGLRAPGAAPPQRGLRPARRRPALVRLVRLQRRQRLLDRRRQRARLHQHAALPRLHAGRLVRPRPDPRPQGDRDRGGDRDHRRLRRDHPGRRLHQPRLGDGARRPRRRCPATR